MAVQKAFRSENSRTVATLGKGHIFGEMSLFDGRPHMATVVAVEDTEVSSISRNHFDHLVSSMNPTMKEIVLMLVSRLRQTVDGGRAGAQGRRRQLGGLEKVATGRGWQITWLLLADRSPAAWSFIQSPASLPNGCV